MPAMVSPRPAESREIWRSSCGTTRRRAIGWRPRCPPRGLQGYGGQVRDGRPAARPDVETGTCLRCERRQARAARRARRLALLLLLGAVFVVALALTAFGGGSPAPPAVIPRLGAASASAAAQTRPTPEIVALRGPVRLQLPIAQAQVTAIGYHAAHDGALSLSPVGQQANEGLVQRILHGIFGGGGGTPRWYQLGGGGTSALDVGAAAGS